MKNDKLLVIAFFGIISTVPAEILTLFLVYLGFGKFSIYQLASLLITFNRPTLLMGFIVDALIGSFVSFIFCYLLEKLGSDFLVTKVTFGSIFAWLVCELAFTFFIEGKFFDIRPINDYYNHIFGAIIFGITLGMLFKKFMFMKATS